MNEKWMEEIVTYAPQDLLAMREYLQQVTGMRATELGIVGDAAHAASGGYHMGINDLARVYGSDFRKSDGRREYSVRQQRDYAGRSNAASALDVGYWSGLRSFSVALVDACRRGDPSTRAVREVIYSPDGSAVRHYDAIGEQTGTSDTSHRYHTHISFWRDTEGTTDRLDFLSLMSELIEGRETSPATSTMLGEHMALMRTEGDPNVFLTNGIIAVAVSEADFADLQYLGNEGTLSLAAGGLRVIGDSRRALIGRIVGPVPTGWESQAYMPPMPTATTVNVELTAEVISAISAAAAAAVGTTFSDLTEKVDEIDAAISDITTALKNSAAAAYDAF
ncbi:MAG: hypothetical protein A2Y75_05460 [Candidatus Solincola sediminis]|uniref:Uncharacterized protein n=1 Tax=Candidatus Solincola sediminis TaxID=1797199 RepID=A0A1F2WG77_9ACTN|nr:MAG: hypothetical protein A2Y75_05460 [Candidatus Solincola sediminis]